jgi:hypothetical protein
MADIFISYKREDLLIAKDLAGKLFNLGLSVWWDRDIPVGKAYDQVIEEELAKSKCIIVLWTSKSVASLNVKEEALEGLRRNILIPVAIGNVHLPYGFKMIQTMYWNEDAQVDDKEFNELVNQIGRLVDNTAAYKKNVVIKDDAGNVAVEQELHNKVHETIDTSKQTMLATLHFIKPNYATSVINSVVSLKSLEMSAKIYIDGEKVGKILSNETLTVSVKPGDHYLQVKGGGAFYGTGEKVTVNSGETLRFRIGTSITGGLKLSRVT